LAVEYYKLFNLHSENRRLRLNPLNWPGFLPAIIRGFRDFAARPLRKKDHHKGGPAFSGVTRLEYDRRNGNN
jgi:hypothetical protein